MLNFKVLVKYTGGEIDGAIEIGGYAKLVSPASILIFDMGGIRWVATLNDAAIAAEKAKPTAKGADLLAKYGADTDPAALAAYQLVAEGRAEAVWDQMAESIEDEFISSAYAKIARDEGFHSTIGARKLETLAGSDDEQARILGLVAEMRKDLFEVSCLNTTTTDESRQLVADAYGW